MTIIAALIGIAGNLLTIYGLIILTFKGFKKNPLWVLAFFLLPPFGVIAFTILNIKEAWKPWAFIIGGLIITAVALQMSPKLREHLEENYSHLPPAGNFELKDRSRGEQPVCCAHGRSL